MSPHLIESAAQAQRHERRRSAERRRLAAHARARRPVSATRPRGRPLGLRSLRAVFG